MKNKYISVYERNLIIRHLDELSGIFCKTYSHIEGNLLDQLESFVESIDKYILFIKNVEQLTYGMAKRIVNLIYLELYFIESLISSNY